MTGEAALQRLADALGRSKHLVVLTGAGISAESGIPTFRDALTGRWAHHDPMRLASPEGFRADPELVTAWYDMRVGEVVAREPNAGHRALAEIEADFGESGRRFDLLTQNVDGFHQRAGSKRVVELHGSLRTWKCTRCTATLQHPGTPFAQHPPRCDACAEGLLRPGVVWFGEHLPAAALEHASAALESCDTFLAIGTSAVVYPAAGFGETVHAGGGTVCEINIDDTPLSDLVDISVRAPAAAVLPRVCEMLSDGRSAN